MPGPLSVGGRAARSVQVQTDRSAPEVPQIISIQHNRNFAARESSRTTRWRNNRGTTRSMAMTAAVIMQLAQERKLSVDDPVEVRPGSAQR